MSIVDLKDSIVRLLEEVAERASYINHRHPEKQDLSLDIDLLKDDLRRLYRQFELLKNANGEKPGHPEESAGHSATVPPVSGGSQSGGDPTAKKKEAPPVKSEASVSRPETPPARSEESVSRPEVPRANSTESVPRQPAPGSRSLGHPEEKPAAKQSEPHPGRLPKEKPVDIPEEIPADKPVEEPREKRADKAEDQPAASPKIGSGNHGPGNNKAVIDLLSEYAGRTIGDQYLEEDRSVHQRISNQKEDKSIGTRMQRKPIANLKEAIGVNEKFLFINELFKGNIQAYNEAISRLNEMDDAKTAFDYLNELSMIHSWDATRSASTIEKLADLVHRRHMSK